MRRDQLPQFEGPFAYIAARLRGKVIGWVLDLANHADRTSLGIAVLPHEYVGRHVIVEGVYEWRELRVLAELVRRENLVGTICLDVGTNIGNHAVVFSAWFQRVIGFEANPALAALAQANALLTGRSNLRVHAVGLGESGRTLGFALQAEGNQGTGSFVGAEKAGADILQLRITRGDDFLAAEEASVWNGSERIGLIKCDVEGFELQVLTGLSATIASHRPIIVFESNRGTEGQAASDFLADLGYQHLYRIAQTGDRSGRTGRVLQRCLRGHACWIEPVASVPTMRANMIASTMPLAGIGAPN